MSQEITINGKKFVWSVVNNTSKFRDLLRAYDNEEIDVLVIESSDSSFRIVIRIFSNEQSKWLGPCLVLAGLFNDNKKSIPENILIQLRPKLTQLSQQGPSAPEVERILQWIDSDHFKPIRVNSSGGYWVGYGEKNA